MDCREIKRRIPIYLDNELEPNECQIVKEHLTGCPVCQKEFAAYEQSWAMLGELKEIEPEAGYVGKFWTRLALEQSWQERVTEAIKTGFLKKRLVPIGVTLCIMVLAGSFALKNYMHLQQTDRAIISMDEEDLEMVTNIELAENFDLIQDMDFLEDLEVLESFNGLES